jgi:hypothetical protein
MPTTKPNRMLSAAIALLFLAASAVSARSHHRPRAPRAPEKMFFVQVKQDGDSLKATDVSVVKGRAKSDKLSETPGGEGSWYCEIQGEDGKVAWSGFLENPFLAAHPRPPGEAESRVGVVRFPYKKGFTKAIIFKTVTGPVPMPDRSAALLSVPLASAPEE